MDNKTATIIGSTGLIGSRLLQLLINDNYFDTIKVLVRRPLGTDNPKVIVRVIDFSDIDAFRDGIVGSDAVFCAVGTTQKKVKGDKIAYYKVDYDIPVNAAKFCAETDCHHFLLVSSVGADSKSSNFYLKLKGEVEDAVRDMNIPFVSVFRPSMLLGKREEFRLGEMIAKAMTVPVSFLFPSKYKPVNAEIIAKSMIAASRLKVTGFQIYHYKEIFELMKGH